MKNFDDWSKDPLGFKDSAENTVSLGLKQPYSLVLFLNEINYFFIGHHRPHHFV